MERVRTVAASLGEGSVPTVLVATQGGDALCPGARLGPVAVVIGSSLEHDYLSFVQPIFLNVDGTSLAYNIQSRVKKDC